MTISAFSSELSVTFSLHYIFTSPCLGQLSSCWQTINEATNNRLGEALVRGLLHLWYFSLSEKQNNRVASSSVDRATCHAVLWVLLCARRVFQHPAGCCIIGHLLLTRFPTLDQRGRRLSGSRKVIVTPDDLLRGT